MNIIKIEKKKNGFYEFTSDNIKVLLHEDLLLKYKILTKGNIEEEIFNKLIRENEKYILYEECATRLRKKPESKQDIEGYLLGKGTSVEVVDFIIKNLESKRFLDDEIFSRAYANDSINLKRIGPNKVRNDLEHRGVSKYIIEAVLSEFDQSIFFDNASKLVDKKIRANKTNSKTFLYNKINFELQKAGYDKSLITEILDKIEYDDTALYNDLYKKLYKKYSKKYSANQIDKVVQSKLVLKGFKSNFESLC